MPDGLRYWAVPYHGGFRLFCFETGRYFRAGTFTKRQKARYSRLQAGFKKAQSRNERVSFLTLSTAYEKAVDKYGVPLQVNGRFVPKNPTKYNQKIKGLNYAFTKMKQKIERYWQRKIYIRECKLLGQIPYTKSVKKGLVYLKINYPRLFLTSFRKLKYYKIKTAEGGGVLHIIFRKDRDCPKIPKEFIHKQWLKIWGSWNSSIDQVKLTDGEKLSRYLIGQYFTKQPVIRMSYGHQWVYKGFSKSFKKVVETYGTMRREYFRAQKQQPSTFKQAIRVWNEAIEKGCLPKTQYQRRFQWRKLKQKTSGVIGEKKGFSFPSEKYNLQPLYYKDSQLCIDSPKYTGKDAFVVYGTKKNRKLYRASTGKAYKGSSSISIHP